MRIPSNFNTDPNRGKSILHCQQEGTLLYQQEGERFSSPLETAEPMRGCHDSTINSHYTLNSKFAPMNSLLFEPPGEPLFITALPTCPSSLKRVSSLLFLPDL